MNNEVWKSVPGFEGYYEASNIGRIRTVDRIGKTCYGADRKLNGKLVAQNSGKKGYLRVSSRIHGVMLVHRLVALTWIQNPDALPVINHIDGNKENNRIENLEWCTQSYNMKHAHRNGLAKGMVLLKGDKSIAAKLTERKVANIKFRLLHGDRAVDLAKEYGVNKNTIAELKAGRSWSHVNADNN